MQSSIPDSGVIFKMKNVDILMMQDGSLLVSDDRAGVIYRIAYGE
jgi:glucose/arabinose dehydrogenase